ncbi:MAG: class A beta-lactamase [Ancalomicrobiaceae bacterium]|nr:class A beta-lactamase [Ancalomicrobiaceae bacterium]
MPDLLNRRRLVLALSAAPFVALGPARAADAPPAEAALIALEKTFGGHIGIAAIDTASGRELRYRADERFPFCSTFKVMAASALLARLPREPDLLAKHIAYAAVDLVTYSPITETHVGDGLRLGELTAAAIQMSDNTAANLLLREVGGPGAVTTFARSIGDDSFHLDRWETELNTAIPGDPRDTTTPAAMAKSLQKLLLGDVLSSPGRDQLKTWMLGTKTGDARIRAGVPKGWQVADKTGTGYYGTANDIGVVWPNGNRAPVVLAIYTTQTAKDAKASNEVIASAARIVAEWVG